MQTADVACHLDRQRKSRTDHIQVAWVAEDIDNHKTGTAAEHDGAGYEVRHQHTGQNEVCLGPESGSLPDRDEREAVAT